MNMYITHDQNTVVLWADQNAPQLLAFNPGAHGCDGTCAFESITNGFAGCLLSNAHLFPACVRRFRHDHEYGNFRRRT